MLNKRYGGIIIAEVKEGRVVPRLTSGIEIKVNDCTPEDLIELQRELGELAVVGNDGTFNLVTKGTTSRQAPITAEEDDGFDVICKKCGSMMSVKNSWQSSESIYIEYDSTWHHVLLECQGCGQEVHIK